MNGPSDVIDLVHQWVERAEEDFRTAEYTLTMPENCPYGTICFHAQQCVEKYIKALLVWRAIDFPKTHDIGELIQLLPSGVALPLTEAEQELLTDYATGTRYPGDREPISRTEAEEAVTMARKVREVIRTHLPKEAIEK
jgi:HEPN domain-containing protein